MYSIQNPKDRAQTALGQAQSAYGQMMPEIEAEAPGKSVGGAISTGMAGVGTGAASAMALEAAGASAATVSAIGGPLGLGAFAVLGAASYLLS